MAILWLMTGLVVVIVLLRIVHEYIEMCHEEKLTGGYGRGADSK